MQERVAYKMQNSSPDNDSLSTSLHYNDSGYMTNTNLGPLSFSSNSEPSLEASEDLSLHSKQGECLSLPSSNSVYFCEDAVFDEPKLEGPPLLTNNYEEFSSLIKFSLEEGTGSYLTNSIHTTTEQSTYTEENKLVENNSESKDNSTMQKYDNSFSNFSCTDLDEPTLTENNYNNSIVISENSTQILVIQEPNYPKNVADILKDFGVYHPEVKLIDKRLDTSTNSIISSTTEENISASDFNDTLSKTNISENTLNFDSTHEMTNFDSECKLDTECSNSLEISPVIQIQKPIQINQSYLNELSSCTSSSSSSSDFKGFSNSEIYTNNYSNNIEASKISFLGTDNKHQQNDVEIGAKPQCNDNLNVQIIKSQSSTPTKPVTNPMNPAYSPELFSDDDEEPEEECRNELLPVSVENVSATQVFQPQKETYVKCDKKLLKRVQETLSGVPPPPSVTILQISVQEMLDKLNVNKDLFLTKNNLDNSTVTSTSSSSAADSTEKNSSKTLLIRNSQQEVNKCAWPEILDCRYHGLHHNRSKVTEDFEDYCKKYGERYVGSETTSSCTVWSMLPPMTPSKRRNAKLRRVIRSPGHRLSHLANRGKTFSISNLKQAGANLSVIGNSIMARKPLINVKKSDNRRRSPRKSPRKSPWKRSPRKSPQKRLLISPGGSAKKRFVRRLEQSFATEAKAGCSRESKVSSTKRALFQSPEHNRATASTSSWDGNSLTKPKSKRALFMSPSKRASTSTATVTSAETANVNLINCDKKRKRSVEQSDEPQPNKYMRSSSFDMNQSASVLSASVATNSGISLQRTRSEVLPKTSPVKGELSHVHRQKVLWAIHEALRTHNKPRSHPDFNKFAKILGRVVMSCVPDLLSNGPRLPGSTSERLLYYANKHCADVIAGKTYEEIKQKIRDEEARLRVLKRPTGYVPLQQQSATDNNRSNSSSINNKSSETVASLPAPPKNILQDKIMNIDSNNSPTSGAANRSPANKLKSNNRLLDENSKIRSIRRQIIFDDTEISKSCNTDR